MCVLPDFCVNTVGVESLLPRDSLGLRGGSSNSSMPSSVRRWDGSNKAEFVRGLTGRQVDAKGGSNVPERDAISQGDVCFLGVALSSPDDVLPLPPLDVVLPPLPLWDVAPPLLGIVLPPLPLLDVAPPPSPPLLDVAPPLLSVAPPPSPPLLDVVLAPPLAVQAGVLRAAPLVEGAPSAGPRLTQAFLLSFGSLKEWLGGFAGAPSARPRLPPEEAIALFFMAGRCVLEVICQAVGWYFGVTVMKLVIFGLAFLTRRSWRSLGVSLLGGAAWALATAFSRERRRKTFSGWNSGLFWMSECA